MQDHNDSIFSDIEPDESLAPPMQRFMTGFLDFAIDIVFIFLVYQIVSRDLLLSIIKLSAAIIPVAVILFATIYRFIFLMLFNKTIGMMITRVKFLNKQFQPLSNVEKLFSLFRTRFSQIRLYKDK
jgi:uncharacterized RDD family membrane protein YckC